MGGPILALGGGGGLIALLIALFLGIDPGNLGGPSANVPQGQTRRATDPAEDRLAQFTKVIFADTEDVWTEQFQRLGKTYHKPTLVLFSGAVGSACGRASSSVGPFYCARDSRIYIDLSFYKLMEKRLRAGGDFAQAYVIAHEVGHHVQRLLGYRGQASSVPLELQADYLAGVWAHHGQKKFDFLEEGDLDEAINAAYQIGDDTLQKRSQGYAVPDSFTHGTSKQRSYWFREGFRTGDVRQARRLFEGPLDPIAE